MENFKLGLAQLTSTDSLENNLKIIHSLLNSLKEDCDLVSFPENVFYFRLKKEKIIKGYSLKDSFFDEFQKFCDEKNTNIHWGGVPIQEGNKCFNASILQRPNQPTKITYRKIHLFDACLGDLILKESQQYCSGSTPEIFEINSWVFGQSICYDLRFAELYLEYVKKGVDVILVPSAFAEQTGKLHWHTLLKARAIEGQCFVAASDQAGEHRGVDGGCFYSYGHSLVVNPWGEVTTDLKNKSPIIEITELRKDLIKDVRRKMPMSDHRRL